MLKKNHVFSLSTRHSLILALLLCLTAQTGVFQGEALAQSGRALHASASQASVFRDSDWAAARARRNQICNEKTSASDLGRKKGAASYSHNFLNDAIKRSELDFVDGRDGTQIGGVKMHSNIDPDLSIGFGMPGASDKKGASSNVQMQLDF